MQCVANDARNCQRVEVRQNLTDFLAKMNSYRTFIMIVYSVFALGFPLSEIKMTTNMMGNVDQA